MRSGIISLLCFALFIGATHTYAGMVEVPKDFPQLQGAIDAVSDYDTIMVEPGSYTENIIIQGKKIVLKSYAGSENSLIQPLDSSLNVISISGSGASGTVISGFSISGSINGNVILISDSASPIIEKNIFHDNIASSVYDRAVINSISSSNLPIIRKNIFYDNNGMSSVWIQQGKADVINNTFFGNRAAVMCYSGEATLKNNIISNCAGIAIEGVFALIDYNVYFENDTDYG